MILCSTLHDPENRLLDDLASASKVILKNFDTWVVRTSLLTNKEVVKELEKLGVFVVNNKHAIIPDNTIENDHLIALSQGYEHSKLVNANTLIYIDGDRVVMAAKYFKDEFKKMADKVNKITYKEKYYLNLARSTVDFFTHHAPLVQTELGFATLYSDVFLKPIDIGSTGHVMSLDVAQAIIEQSPMMDRISYPHPLWLIIAKKMGAVIDTCVVEKVLTFETPEQYRNEINERLLKLGKHDESQNYKDPRTQYAVLQDEYITTLGIKGPLSATSPEEWGRRFDLEKSYLQVLKKYLNDIVSSKTKVAFFEKEIDEKIKTITAQKEAIIKTLSTPEDQIRARLRVAMGQ